MNELTTQNAIAPHAWLQHHLPWLGLLALVLSLFRDDEAVGFDPDELNG